jgi:hypothetical protein
MVELVKYVWVLIAAMQSASRAFAPQVIEKLTSAYEEKSKETLAFQVR